MKQRGFTLLEVMVASLIMAVAITGLLSTLSTSLRTASRLTESDRAALLARQKMDEFLVDKQAPMQGQWDPQLTGGIQAGWIAQITPFETPPGAGPGTYILERIQLQVWWLSSGQRRVFPIEGYRRALMTADGGTR